MCKFTNYLIHIWWLDQNMNNHKQEMMFSTKVYYLKDVYFASTAYHCKCRSLPTKTKKPVQSASKSCLSSRIQTWHDSSQEENEVSEHTLYSDLWLLPALSHLGLGWNPAPIRTWPNLFRLWGRWQWYRQQWCENEISEHSVVVQLKA